MLWVLFGESRKFDLIALVPTQEYTIGDLARSVAAASGIKQGVEFDTSKADGQPRKYMSNERLASALANFRFTSLEEGIERTVRDYRANKASYRH